VPDFLDVDADNDGIYDIYEAQATSGYVPPSGTDDDNDGIDNAYDDDDLNWGGAGAAGITPINTDTDTGNTSPDYLDTDSDGDNVPDMQEAWDSLDDGDSQPDAVSGSCSTDSDGDGYVDCFDSNDSDPAVWTTDVTPTTDDGTAGATASLGVDHTLANEVDDIFPNNASGNSNTEPDWRDLGNAACATATAIYAMTDAGTLHEWNLSNNKHESSANTGVIRATTLCAPIDGWYRFYNPLEPDHFLFAIQNGTNTVDLTQVIDYIEIEVEAAPVVSLGSDNGFAVMARSWKVVTKGSLDGSLNIRFYFTPTEYSDFTSAANNMYTNYLGGNLEMEWFKVANGVDYSQLPSSTNNLSNDAYTDLASNVNGRNDGQADSDPQGNSKNHIQFNGLTGFSGGTIGATMSGTLPVEWLEFLAKREGEIGLLSWATASETNADYFSIERSVDGNQFIPIGTEKASGTTSQISAYSFRDATLYHVAVERVYYRLRQIDLNGGFDYSNIVELKLDENRQTLWLNAMPIPASKVLRVEYSAIGKQASRLEVYTLTGTKLHSQSLINEQGEVEIVVESWAEGIYYLRLQGPKSQIVRKFEVAR
ncbi:MAG: T9SS type A sorting domain-containing protein, partial [Bacteroidia bacterium]